MDENGEILYQPTPTSTLNGLDVTRDWVILDIKEQVKSHLEIWQHKHKEERCQGEPMQGLPENVEIGFWAEDEHRDNSV